MSGARQSGVAIPLRPAALPAATLAALAAIVLAVLAACSSSPATAPARSRAPPEALPAPAQVHEPGVASDDWRALLIVPFGSPLKDVPLRLHEVLLFRDQGRAVGADLPEDAECYAADTAAPRFAGQDPEYLLCFKQDRLIRIQAAVHLPPAEAPGVFAAACARWLKTAVPSGESARAPGAALPNAEAPGGDACEGRDGAVRFSGRLGDQGDQSEAQATLSITLDSVADP